MPNQIQNRYASLFRSLDLKGPGFKPMLRDDVQPVVVLHDHCEADCAFTFLNQPGATGAALLLALPVVGGLKAGSYKLRFELQWNIAAATATFRRMNFNLANIASGSLGAVLWEVGFGTANRQAGSDVFTLEKIHVPEGTVFYAVLADAVLAADHLILNMFLQEI